MDRVINTCSSQQERMAFWLDRIGHLRAGDIITVDGLAYVCVVHSSSEGVTYGPEDRRGVTYNTLEHKLMKLITSWERIGTSVEGPSKGAPGPMGSPAKKTPESRLQSPEQRQNLCKYDRYVRLSMSEHERPRTVCVSCHRFLREGDVRECEGAMSKVPIQVTADMHIGLSMHKIDDVDTRLERAKEKFQSRRRVYAETRIYFDEQTQRRDWALVR